MRSHQWTLEKDNDTLTSNDDDDNKSLVILIIGREGMFKDIVFRPGLYKLNGITISYKSKKNEDKASSFDGLPKLATS